MPIPALDALRQEMVLHLITLGRKTGKLRTIEIWFVIYRQRIYLLAEHGLKAQWVRNIQADPEVTIQIGKYCWRAHGRILDDALDRQEWRAVAELARQKYGWGEGLPVAFDARLVEESENG
jgi:deazaflavin-dependent oxidoreductase (nitroreductase family)